MKPSEVLQEALTELKKGPHTWVQGSFAQDALGNETNAYVPEAACRCAVGHIRYAADKLTNTSADRRVLELQTARYVNKAITGKLPDVRHTWKVSNPIMEVNDDEKTKYEDVVAFFEKAVVLAKKAGR